MDPDRDADMDMDFDFDSDLDIDIDLDIDLELNLDLIWILTWTHFINSFSTTSYYVASSNSLISPCSLLHDDLSLTFPVLRALQLLGTDNEHFRDSIDIM